MNIGNKLKIILLSLTLSGLVLHFLSVFIANNLPNSGQSKLKYWAQAYTYPYFFQTWTLFSPPPSSNFNLIAQYENNGKQTLDIFADVLNTHRSNVLKTGEQPLLTFVNSIHYFEKMTTSVNPVNVVDTCDVNFKILRHAALNYLRNTESNAIKSLTLTLVVTDTKTGQQRIYYTN